MLDIYRLPLSCWYQIYSLWCEENSNCNKCGNCKRPLQKRKVTASDNTFFPFQRGYCDARCYFAMTTCWTPNNHSLPASLASPHFRSYRSVSSTYCRTCWEKRKKNTSPELHEGSHVTTFLASHTLVGLYHYQVNSMYWEPKVNILLQHTTEGILFVSAAQKSLSGLWRLLTFLVVTKTAAYLFNVSVIIRTKVSNVKEKTVWEVQGQHVQRTHSVKVTVLE